MFLSKLCFTQVAVYKHQAGFTTAFASVSCLTVT